MEIYQEAKKYMVKEGNLTQWDDTYPTREILLADIAQNELFVIKINGSIHGVFAFIIGEDETYQEISNGEWLNDLPYGTIHRIASSFVYPGILTLAIKDSLKKILNIKIDTHPANKTMQAAIIKQGFSYCGEIKVKDGSKRLAYQYYKEEK
ncbi:hypothetical protein SAMN05421767_1189 [Granulicatella balaenopterae]|uniref:N-acetyltransferase domain-containing protein n=1 Tax=Granulicatella balaenopterae TaxID=137733 RepID=A0A1H9L9F5_9LACT|nr:N-acetyltransferase [Granulicatella balaenopterae]SER07938.1 hypothetical protein SAMN05421767_1189 [Granulicatella balaenopterae]